MSDELKRTLYVEIVGASDLMPKDGQGSASPYCIVDYDGQRQQTETKVKELNPVWNSVLKFTVFEPSAMDSQDLRVSIFSAKKRIQRHPKFLGQVRIRGCSFAKKGEEAVVYYKLKRRNLFSQVKGEIGIKVWWVDEPLLPGPQPPEAAAEAPKAPPAPAAEATAEAPPPPAEAAAPAPAPEITPEQPPAAPPPDPAPAPPTEPPAAEPSPAAPAEPVSEPAPAAADKKEEPAAAEPPPAEPAPPAEPEQKKDPEPAAAAEKKDESAAEARTDAKTDAAADAKKDEVAATESTEVMESEIWLHPVYWDHNLPYSYEVPWNNFISSSVLDNPYVNLPRVEGV